MALLSECHRNILPEHDQDGILWEWVLLYEQAFFLHPIRIRWTELKYYTYIRNKADLCPIHDDDKVAKLQAAAKPNRKRSGRKFYLKFSIQWLIWFYLFIQYTYVYYYITYTY